MLHHTMLNYLNRKRLFGPSADTDEGEPVASPEIDRKIGELYAVREDGDEQGERATLRGIAEATRALHNMRGLPVFAHHPLPPQLIDAEFGNAHLVLWDDMVALVDRFVRKFDHSLQRPVYQQVMSQLVHDRIHGGHAPIASVGDQAHPRDGDRTTPRGLRVASGAADDDALSQRIRSLLKEPGHTLENEMQRDPYARRPEMLESRRDQLQAVKREHWSEPGSSFTQTGEDAGSRSTLETAGDVQLTQAPAGTYPRGREPKDVNSEDPRYPWHPKWERYDLDRDGDGEYGTWHTKEGDFEWNQDGGRTWHRVGPPSPYGWGAGGPPNKSDNPKGIIFRKSTDLIS